MDFDKAANTDLIARARQWAGDDNGTGDEFIRELCRRLESADVAVWKTVAACEFALCAAESQPVPRLGGTNWPLIANELRSAIATANGE